MVIGWAAANKLELFLMSKWDPDGVIYRCIADLNKEWRIYLSETTE